MATMFLLALAAASAAVIDLPAGPSPLENPLKGYAAYSAPGFTHEGPVSMAYAYAYWSELEPKEGEYAFEAWENKEWDAPLARGKHIVFRVTMDYPGQPVGVPKWLIDQGVKLNEYTDHGGGKSPDYEDPRLQKALLRLIDRLGGRYNKNPRVAFVQVGLLGHWGEWHTWPREELFASEATQRLILARLRRAFPDKVLMARNPAYESKKLPWLGFHDDMIPEDTLGPDDWMFLPSMRRNQLDQNWKVAATGGEMVPGQAGRYLGPDWSNLLKSVQEAHFSWIGPYCPAIEASSDPFFKDRRLELIRKLGYTFQWKHLTLGPTRKGGARAIKLEGINTGVAPFYYPWPVEFSLIDNSGKIVHRWQPKADIRTWLPGAIRLKSEFPSGLKAGRYQFALGIIDPWTGRPAITFANKLPIIDGYTVLTQVEISPQD